VNRWAAYVIGRPRSRLGHNSLRLATTTIITRRAVKVPATMKQRITYVVKDPDEFTPEQLQVKQDGHKDSLSLNGVHAAKEHRVTLGLDELPREVPPHSIPRTSVWLLRTHILTRSSLVLHSNNGTSCTSAGHPHCPTDRARLSHHVSRRACMSSSPLSSQRLSKRYACSCIPLSALS
jgi:hypothetical protein